MDKIKLFMTSALVLALCLYDLFAPKWDCNGGSVYWSVAYYIVIYSYFTYICYKEINSKNLYSWFYSVCSISFIFRIIVEIMAITNTYAEYLSRVNNINSSLMLCIGMILLLIIGIKCLKI